MTPAELERRVRRLDNDVQATYELLHGISRQDGVTVVMVTHNLNLASRFADRLLLLDRGRVAAQGTPSEVVREDVLESVYRWPLRVTPHPGPGGDEGAPQVTPLRRPQD